MPIIGIKFFDKLKHIIRGHIDIGDIHLFNYAPVNNNITTIQLAPSDVLLKQNSPTSVILDLKRVLEALPPAQKEAVRKAIYEEVTIEGTPLLEDISKGELDEILEVENNRDIKEILVFFRTKIRPEDYAALRSAIYIKNKFDAHDPRVRSLRNDLRGKFGLRGIKISNLWSENYFRDLIMPLYRELSTHSGFSNDEFLEMFELIVEEEAFAIFVPSTMTSDQLDSIVHNKILRNMRYGVYSITIHGIGKECVDTIRDAISYIESNYKVVDRSISERKNIIRAKFWFKKE